MTFDEAFTKLLGHEGGYSDHQLSGKRRGDLLHRLPASKPELYCVSAAPKDRGPAGERPAFSAELIPVCGPEVIGLLKRRCPSDVSRLIAAVIVYAVDRCSRGRLPHVREKGFETVKPFRTNLYAAAAPEVKPGVVRVLASILHGCPSRIRAAFSQPMSADPSPELLIVEAATRSCRATSEFVGAYQAWVTAITDALPSGDGATVGVSGALAAAMNNQSPKALA